VCQSVSQTNEVTQWLLSVGSFYDCHEETTSSSDRLDPLVSFERKHIPIPDTATHQRLTIRIL